MAQQNIEYGNFPNDPSANSIRVSFEKIQNNFDELYGNLSNISGNVSRVTAGPGIVANPATGNVTVSALFSSLTVHSNTIQVSGQGGFLPPGGNVNSDWTVNNSTNTLTLEIGQNSSQQFTNLTLLGNLTVSGETITSSNANIELSNGNIRLSNGTFTGNIVSSSGNSTVLFVGTNSIIEGDSKFKYDIANTRLTVIGNIITETVDADYLIKTVNLNVSNTANVTNTATVGQLVSVGNVRSGAVLTAVDLEISNTANISNTVNVGELISSGNISGVDGAISGNLSISGLTTTDSLVVVGNIVAALFSGNGSGLSSLAAGNITTGILDANRLSGNYSIDIIGSAVTANTVTTQSQPNITEVGTLTTLTVAGNIQSGSLLSSGNIQAIDGNFSGILNTQQLSVADLTTTDTLSVTGNGNILGNLSITDSVSCQVITVSGNSQFGNVNGGNFAIDNLIASGSMTAVQLTTNQVTVDGNTLSGNVYANGGTIGAATAILTGSITTVNGIFSGNITVGNISANSTVSANTVIASEQILSGNITNGDNINTVSLSSGTVSANTVTANAITVSTMAEASVVKFSGLSTDPANPVGGEMYYNTITGKFRIYNGVLAQWQSLN